MCERYIVTLVCISVQNTWLLCAHAFMCFNSRAGTHEPKSLDVSDSTCDWSDLNEHWWMCISQTSALSGSLYHQKYLINVLFVICVYLEDLCQEALFCRVQLSSLSRLKWTLSTDVSALPYGEELDNHSIQFKFSVGCRSFSILHMWNLLEGCNNCSNKQEISLLQDS